jgi:hypothetical protein
MLKKKKAKESTYFYAVVISIMRLRHYFSRNGLLWRESWTVYHPKSVHRHLIPRERVQIAHSPHLTFYQARKE